MQRLKLKVSEAMLTMLVILVAIIAAAVETDVFVPAFPSMLDYFSTTEAKIKMILSINFLGLCLASLVVGPLSDSFGRRKVLLWGLSLFALAGIACTYTTSIEVLLFWRFIQGMGCSVAFVVPGAIIFDLYTKEEAAQILGWYNSIITLAMSCAPLIGTYLQLVYGWQANFVLVAILASFAWLLVARFVKESLPKDRQTPWHFPSILKGYGQLLTSFPAMANNGIICFVFAGYMIYIANLSLLFITYFGMEEKIYALYQGAVLLVFAMVSIFCGRIINYIGTNRTRFWGNILSFIGAILLLLVALIAPKSPLLITLAMSIFTAGFAVMLGIVFGDYMEIYPKIKGIASALGNALRLFFMAGGIALSNTIFNGSTISIAILVFGCSMVAMVFLLLLQAKSKKAEM